MFSGIEYGKAERKYRKKWTCTDSLCLKDNMSTGSSRDNQQGRDKLLCKLNLC